MAPWPSRLNDPLPLPPSREPPLPPLPRPELEDVRQQLSRPPARRPVPSSSRPSDPNLVDASQVPPDLVPTLPAEHRAAPNPRPSSHGRSMSHPFPSLFSSKRKMAQKNPSPDDFDSDSDSDAEMLGLGPGSKQRRPTQPAGPSKVNGRPSTDKDFASGNCMTCGAMSRWPKGLKVFKCTLCMTINDLVDINSVVEANNHAVGYRRSSEDATPISKSPISLEGTKHMTFVFDEPTEPELKQIEGHILEAQEHLRKTLLKVTENILKRPGRPHSPIIKRILGLLSNTPADCHNHLISWFARLPESRFIQLKDFAGGFLAYRLIRQHDKKHEVKVDVTAGLIPNMAAGRSPATLHAAVGQPRQSRSKKPKEQPKIVYHDDWQTKAAARVIGLLFAANNNAHHRRHIAGTPSSQDEVLNSTSVRDQVQARGQIVPTSDFYITLLDDSDLVADFEAWERKRSKFSFCQFPFLLSIGAKIQIMEHDAKRQMHNKARDAFFDSILSRRNVEQYLTLNVRRDCLVEDSLTGVSEVIGGGGEDIKKGLRIVFQGEEGVDAGGLKKEWFLLLVREVFNPDHGMFVYDEDSQYCYFNPNSFETSDQFFLVGVVFGLAIYNSTILDVAFPPFAFRKLLTAAPPPSPGLSTQPRPAMAYTLDDLAEFRPRLAKGLRQLLDFDGDVESTFCLDFVIDVEKYGYTERVPLCPGGLTRPVTNSNRREYVDLYVKYLLDAAVTRQFEPFKRGFFTVCGGNALSLFRPEEIELLVRGSDEPLDITSLRVSAEYENWGNKTSNPDQTEPTLRWFWESFERANPRDQRRLLAFITGSDRIPAMGAASLTIRISCLGDDNGRYPTARTCFNALQLWRYNSRERLEKLLWDSVHESEGFGLK
ncbi:hypothetical protein INS49_011581 [Diaporthe citri]|uniref:uncharacterized protein n=1 Tax=Diaporthe citri TaxID=83186 RepID=UPI001C7EF64C|nr:uncharacterized protein INS49_011581 [Diaporthe citri]KAG6360519.1 hypothetical protein INS49_011581 [Diaporthe citri]